MRASLAGAHISHSSAQVGPARKGAGQPAGGSKSKGAVFTVRSCLHRNMPSDLCKRLPGRVCRGAAICPCPAGSQPLDRTDSHGHRPRNRLTSTNLKAGPSPSSGRTPHGPRDSTPIAPHGKTPATIASLQLHHQPGLPTRAGTPPPLAPFSRCGAGRRCSPPDPSGPSYSRKMGSETRGASLPEGCIFLRSTLFPGVSVMRRG